MTDLMSVHAMDFVSQAERNIAKWGDQDFETLALAIAEEAGEVAQAVLQYGHEGKPLRRIYEEAHDLGPLCLQIMRLCDREEPRHD